MSAFAAGGTTDCPPRLSGLGRNAEGRVRPTDTLTRGDKADGAEPAPDAARSTIGAALGHRSVASARDRRGPHPNRAGASWSDTSPAAGVVDSGGGSRPDQVPRRGRRRYLVL